MRRYEFPHGRTGLRVGSGGLHKARAYHTSCAYQEIVTRVQRSTHERIASGEFIEWIDFETIHIDEYSSGQLRLCLRIVNLDVGQGGKKVITGKRNSSRNNTIGLGNYEFGRDHLPRLNVSGGRSITRIYPFQPTRFLSTPPASHSLAQQTRSTPTSTSNPPRPLFPTKTCLKDVPSDQPTTDDG